MRRSSFIIHPSSFIIHHHLHRLHLYITFFLYRDSPQNQHTAQKSPSSVVSSRELNNRRRTRGAWSRPLSRVGDGVVGSKTAVKNSFGDWEKNKNVNIYILIHEPWVYVYHMYIYIYILYTHILILLNTLSICVVCIMHVVDHYRVHIFYSTPFCTPNFHAAKAKTTC